MYNNLFKGANLCGTNANIWYVQDFPSKIFPEMFHVSNTHIHYLNQNITKPHVLSNSQC